MENRNENSPLLENNQGIVRENINNVLVSSISNSYPMVILRILFSLFKIGLSSVVLLIESSVPEEPLRLYLYVTMTLDTLYLFIQILRLPIVKRYIWEDERNALGLILKFLAFLYVSWLIPGNVWYWKCQSCLSEAPSVSAVVLVQLMLGYLYLLAPALFLLCLCACLPVSLVFVILYASQEPEGANEEDLSLIQKENYDPNVHFGEKNCSICANDYEEKDLIVTLKCDSRHFFHEECIKRWLRMNSTCPICRSPFISSDYF